MSESRRAICPVCAKSIRLVDGDIAPHPASWITILGTTRLQCAGSGRPATPESDTK